MGIKRFDLEGEQLIVHVQGEVCGSGRELTHSSVFERVVSMYVRKLQRQQSPLLEIICDQLGGRDETAFLVDLLRALAENRIEQVARFIPQAQSLSEPAARTALNDFVEGLYDFWRKFDRFIVVHAEPGPSSLDQRPYRAFNATIETLTELVRSVYRDACENITGDHPRVYRQVAAGCDVGIIAVHKPAGIPHRYQSQLGQIPFIRQVWIAPPLIIDPPMNKRTGQFQAVGQNPLEGMSLTPAQFVCYPAQVGPVVVFIYFHEQFIGLGCALANLFELASEEQIAAGPQAIYVFGAEPDHMAAFGELPTVFHDDAENDLLVAAVPAEDRFGYFGYLKKMVLTLHNIVMMKQERLPYHGAMVRISLKTRQSANILLIGDTATGKSESLEAFRLLGEDQIRELRIVADDMGSLTVDDSRILAYGTEIGAFIRLDDLQQGYAFQQIDRAVIMSPHKVNARVVLPVTTMSEILHGYPLDFILYANNYEEVDEDHPIIERFEDEDTALKVFREGAAMAKGTTTSSGLVHSYFANIFGPPQYREIHEGLAQKVFQAAFQSGVFVGQLRTRLGIPGYESTGPQAAAKALLSLISTGGDGTAGE